jgi:hypothetical protein
MSHVATVLRRTGCGGGSGCGAVTRTTALPPPLRVRGDGRRAGGRRGVPATTQQAVGGALEPRRSRVGRVGGGGVPSAARVSHRRRPRAPIELESTTRLEAEEEEEAGRTDTEVPREEAGSSGHEALQRYSAPSRSGAGGCGPLAAEEVRRVSHVVLLDLDNCMHLFSAYVALHPARALAPYAASAVARQLVAALAQHPDVTRDLRRLGLPPSLVGAACGGELKL